MYLLIGLLLGLLLGALFGVLGYKFYRVQIKAKRNLRTRAELQGNRVSTVAQVCCTLPSSPHPAPWWWWTSDATW